MKTLLIALLSVLCFHQSGVAQDSSPEDWIMVKFNHDFPNSSQVHWEVIPTYYLVLFVKDDIKCRLFINKKDGTDYALLRYYSGSKLKPELQKKLHHFLRKAEIYGVTEVSTDSGTGYRILMFNNKHIYQIEVDNSGNVGVQKEYKNGGLILPPENEDQIDASNN